MLLNLRYGMEYKYAQEGQKQLSRYLQAQNLQKGYMIFYNFNKGKEYKIDQSEIYGKMIYQVYV